MTLRLAVPLVVLSTLLLALAGLVAGAHRLAVYRPWV